MRAQFTRGNAQHLLNEVLRWLSVGSGERLDELMQQVQALGPGGEVVVEELVSANQNGDSRITHFYVGVMATLIEVYGLRPSD